MPRHPAPNDILTADMSRHGSWSRPGDLVNGHELADVAEQDIRDAAEAIAAQAELSVSGVSEDEISRAVEDGIERAATASCHGLSSFCSGFWLLYAMVFVMQASLQRAR